MTGAGEMLQLRFYFGERDRCGDGPLEAAVMDACARHGVSAAALLRAVEGFGAKHQMRTERMLSLSEDAPLVTVAVGEAAAVEALADELREIAGEGLLALNEVTTPDQPSSPDRVRTLPYISRQSANAPGDGAPGRGAPGDGAPGEGEAGEGAPGEGASGEGAPGDQVRVTIWGPRTGPRSPHMGAVAAFHRHGAEAAMVLLGVDGVLDGERRRGRFLAANHGVPALTVAVGARGKIDAALAEVDGAAPLVTVERLELSSRVERERLHGGAATRVTYVTSEIERRGPHPCYLELIHRLREEGAAGATALRGVWGFRGSAAPHGDRVLALRRDVPILVEAIDATERARRWRELALDLVGEDDVVHTQPIGKTLTLG